MSEGELELIRWLERTVEARRPRGLQDAAMQVPVDLGDDMACIRLSGGQTILLGSDMLVDGSHFDSKTHKLEDIGRKAVCCCLSDCAAMAVKPLALLVSLALPAGTVFQTGKRLLESMFETAEEFDCRLIGGDTTSWGAALAIDIALAAQPWPDSALVTRRGAQPDDRLYASGKLGGSLLGKHMSFTPRIVEARELAQMLGADLHAMIDISDGLSLDLHRLCAASNCGAKISEDSLNKAISPDAHRAAELDGRSPLDHALGDGEDYELLFAASPAAVSRLRDWGRGCYPIGCITTEGLSLEKSDGQVVPLKPEGYRH